jgi:hypothetical protein
MTAPFECLGLQEGFLIIGAKWAVYQEGKSQKFANILKIKLPQ